MAELALAYSPPPCPALDAILAQDEDSLPCSDDRPMPDARAQADPLDYSRDSIRYHLRHMSDRVAVDSDMFVYYVGRDRRGRPVRASVAPDVFVVFGVPDREDRKSYVLWCEPDADIRFVLEVASPSTRTRDHTAKRDVYASLGVREYFLFDTPDGETPAGLLGLCLTDGSYREIASVSLPDGRWGIPSAVTGLVGYVESGRLRWFDPESGEPLDTYAEAKDQQAAIEQRFREEARHRRDAERRYDEARREADARIAELEAALRERGRDVGE